MLRGLLLVAAAAVAWGTTGSVTTVLVAHAAAHPLLIGTARMWLAALVLVPAAALAGGLRVARHDVWRCLAAGACMAAYQATYFTAVTLSGIVLTALVAICSAPLIVAGLARVMLGERLPPRTAAALGLGVAGTVLLVAGPRGAGDVSLRLAAGVALALGAGLSYALYVVIAKATLAGSRALPFTALVFGTAALLLTPLGAATPAPLRQLTLGLPWLVYLGVVATAGAYLVYGVGLRRVPASVAAIGTLLEPLTATVLGVVIFGERLGGRGAAGAALLSAALGLLLVARPAGVGRATRRAGRGGGRRG